MITVEVPENVKKITVVRANVLGDFIFALPALQALKARFPETELVYLGNAWHKKFLQGRPGPVDRVEVIPRCDGMPHESHIADDPKEVEEFFRKMQDEQFDIAFQMHGGGKTSNPFTKKLGAKLSIGFKTPNAIPLDINIPYFLYQNEFLRYLELVSTVGAFPQKLEPELSVTEKDKTELYEKTDIKKPYIVIHPGASDIRRRWPAEKFAAVADVLYRQGFNIYVTGSEYEKEVIDKVVNSMEEEGESLCNRISLNALVALIDNASLLISNDTGPLHVARAIKTPTVGIYWCSNMVMSGPVTVTLNRTCTEWNPDCPLCGTDCSRVDAHQPFNGCTHETSFVQRVEVKEVLKNAAELLGVNKMEEAEKALDYSG